MIEREILQHLERAHHNLGAVTLRMGIQHLIEPDLSKCEQQIDDIIVSLVQAKEKTRLERRKARQL